MKHLTMGLLMALVLANVACSQDKKDNGGDGSPAATPVSPTTPGVSGTPPTYTTGGTAEFFPVSMAVWEDYTGRVPNNPTEFKINIDLRDYDTSASVEAYGGAVKISYKEINSAGTAVYTTGNFISGNTASEARYNHHVNHGLSTWFKGFFEDVRGGLILVVDSIDDLGLWRGKIYYKDFTCGRNPWDPPCNPEKPKRCWFISIGPYDCAAFKTGSLNGDGSWRIDTSIRQYPENYTLLGAFEQMDSDKALNK